MAILKQALTVLFGLIALVFVSGFLLPSTVHVERTIVINAAPADLFPLVSDLSEWQAWSPWTQKDPEMEMVLSGSGVGQTMRWRSENPQVGQGMQEITTSESPTYLKTHLDFDGQGNADAAFTLTPENKGTLVTWSLDMDMREGVPTLQQPISTYLGFWMDSMVGNDYEVGLANLKGLAEQ